MTLGHMARQDAQHARFYNTGASVKGFLGDFCGALQAAFEAGDAAPLEPMYAADFSSPGRGRWVLESTGGEGGVEVLELRSDGGDDYDRGRVLAEAEAYLAELSAIGETACKIYLIEEVELDRRVSLTVRFVLDGVDHEGRELQDRFFWRWHLVPNLGGEAGGGAWLVTGDELLQGTRTARRGGGTFVAADPALAGIDYVHRRDPKLDRKAHGERLQFDVFEHAAGGLSAADYDGDGWPDLFFADGVRSRLYRHAGVGEDGLPRWTEVTAEAGLEGIDQAVSAVFADFDNDGDRDLFVARYLAPGRYFVNDGQGRFQDASAETGLDFVAPATSLTLLDYDRDGYLDLYVGVYGNAFAAFPRLPFYATNGDPNRLYRNEEGRRFRDVSAASGTGDSGWSLAVAAADYDGDGWSDLAVANDFGRKTLYRNNRNGTFTDVAREAGVLDFSGGMGLAFGDFDEDGDIDLYTSNIYSNQRWYGEDQTIKQYLRNVLRTKWALLDFGEYWRLHRLIGDQWHQLGHQIGEGNSVFRNDGDGSFSEFKDTPASFAGWSWGVAFLDYDNDADQDLYAANGWISATPGTDL